jgi:inosine-uridine nucleoside N-ribohydrolase
VSRSASLAHARPARRVAILACLALVVTACGARTPSIEPASGAAVPTAAPVASPVGPEAVVVDTDLSFDDILALAYLLRQPEVDVKAVTVTGTGLVHCLSGLQVMARLLATMARPEVPVSCGRDEPVAGGHALPASWREVADDAYGLALEPASVSNPAMTAPALLASVAAEAPAPITVVALGPLTNLADALEADPGLASKIARIVEMGGAVDVTGNVATDPDGIGNPGPAEWNVYADPVAADAVFRSGIPITLVPLDATQAVPVDQAFVDALGSDHAAAGADVAYELLARRGVNGFDYLWDALAAVVAVDESVATIEPMKLKVVTGSEADSGRTVRADDGSDIRVATIADRAAFEERFLAGLRLGDPRPHPFALAGTINVRFHGTTCTDDAADTAAAGDWMVVSNTTASPGWTYVAVLAFHEGATWDDLLAYQAPADNPGAPPPFVDVPAGSYMEGPSSSRLVVPLAPGMYGFACLRGTDPSGADQTGYPASGPFTVEAAP